MRGWGKTMTNPKTLPRGATQIHTREVFLTLERWIREKDLIDTGNGVWMVSGTQVGLCPLYITVVKFNAILAERDYYNVLIRVLMLRSFLTLTTFAHLTNALQFDKDIFHGNTKSRLVVSLTFCCKNEKKATPLRYYQGNFTSCSWLVRFLS